jgi:hypothetical protein
MDVGGGPTVEETVKRMTKVFERLREAHLTLKPSKCDLFQLSVMFLRHAIDEDGVHADPKKISAVACRGEPRNPTDVKSFLGLTGYYREHIQGYAEIAEPLHALTKKNVSWPWTNVEQAAFDTSKEAMTSSAVLAHPELGKEGWLLDTDASAKALDAVLSQLHLGIEKVIQFASKVLKAEQQRYCTTKRELLAVTWSLKTFRHYLQGREVRLRTDHISVKYWKTMETGMPHTIQRWLQHMSTYNLIVEYCRETTRDCRWIVEDPRYRHLRKVKVCLRDCPSQRTEMLGHGIFRWGTGL